VGGEQLSDFIRAVVVDVDVGLVAKRALVTVGEDVWFLGYGGIYSMRRNMQNRLERQAVAVSSPVQPYIDRINWGAVGCAAATVYDNYVIFAVPIDEATVNNAWLVYDLLAPASDGSRGAWCGLWESAGPIMGVVDFFHADGELWFLDSQGIIRKAFVDVPWDSDLPFDDVPEYDEAVYYQVDTLVFAQVGSEERIYKAIVGGVGNAVADTDYWERVVDAQHALDIEMRLRTRQFGRELGKAPVRLGRGEVLFSHQDPKVSVDILSEDYATEKNLVTDQKYSQVEYDIADLADWDPETDADGFHDPHRQDYTVLLSSDGVLIGSLGIVLGIWETHSVRFLKRLVNDRSFALEITNKRGKLRVEGIKVPVQMKRFAVRDVV